MKYDKDKADISLIPTTALRGVAKVFEYGAKKYAPFNWVDDGPNTEWRRTYSSMQRHLHSWLEREDIDPESGLDHLSHACTQLLILIEHQKHKEMDNRCKNLK
jgi:hypothetical protein